jgi:RecB family exonuclease
MRISYSSFNTYQTCPLKYRYKEIDKKKEPPSKERFFGTLLHDVLQFVHTPGFTSPTLEDALERFASGWDESLFENEAENRGAFSQGVDIIRRYYADNDIASANIVALEKRFAVELPNPQNPDKPHIISGIIDRIDRTEDGFEIIDYKTSRKMPTQENVDSSIQLSIYLLAFLTMYPEERHRLDTLTVSLYYIKHGKKLTAKRTPEQLEEVSRLFLDIISRIEAGEFEPSVSALCNWCGFQSICPMWRHKFEAEVITDKKAKHAIEDFVALKRNATKDRQRAAQLQETIEQFMEQQDVRRVFSSDAIVEKTSRKTYGFDKDTLRSILEPLDRWDDALKIDGVALRKILGELPLEKRKLAEKAKKLERETPCLVVKKRNKE